MEEWGLFPVSHSKDARVCNRTQNGQKSFVCQNDVWTLGKKTIFIAGSHQVITKQVRKAVKEDCFELINDWFDIETTDLLHAY